MDLNLLPLFREVYEHGSVTKAADSLNLSQPTVTQAIKRLERTVGGKLFVKKGRGISATSLANQLYSDTSGLLSQMENALAGLSEFSPLSSSKVCRIALTDLGQIVFLPRLLAKLRTAAPNMRIEVVDLDMNLVEEQLRVGDVDLAVSSKPLAAEFKSETVLQERYVFVCRKELFDSERVESADLLKIPRVQVRDSSGHSDIVEGLTGDHSVPLVVPGFAAIPNILELSDVGTIVPSGFVAAWGDYPKLRVFNLEFLQNPTRVAAYSVRSPMSKDSAWFIEWAVRELQKVGAALHCK